MLCNRIDGDYVMPPCPWSEWFHQKLCTTIWIQQPKCAHRVCIHSVIGLGPYGARFCTLNEKIAHYFHRVCMIFASIILKCLELRFKSVHPPFCFCFFSYRSSSALHHWSSTEILADYWGTFCAGVCPMSVFFVSGNRRIRTHVLVLTK